MSQEHFEIKFKCTEVFLYSTITIGAEANTTDFMQICKERMSYWVKCVNDSLQAATIGKEIKHEHLKDTEWGLV